MKKRYCCFLLLCSFTAIFGQVNKPKILNVYPTTDSIPLNILRFYIQFSAPMQEMDILKHIKLSTEEGKNITGVFFENQFELWNEKRTEITLIVDPGRVKLGLLANYKMGKAFDEGKKYTLTIDSLLMDFNDQKLARSFTKKFLAIKEDKTPPNIKLWKIHLPKANTKEVFILQFNDKINHISAQTLIKIFLNEKQIKGEIVLKKHEQEWFFIPDLKWEKGNYKIIANPILEDISANSINQIFDYKPGDFKQKKQKDFTLKFTLK